MCRGAHRGDRQLPCQAAGAAEPLPARSGERRPRATRLPCPGGQELQLVNSPLLLSHVTQRKTQQWLPDRVHQQCLPVWALVWTCRVAVVLGGRADGCSDERMLSLGFLAP